MCSSWRRLQNVSLSGCHGTFELICVAYYTRNTQSWNLRFVLYRVIRRFSRVSTTVRNKNNSITARFSKPLIDLCCLVTIIVQITKNSCFDLAIRSVKFTLLLFYSVRKTQIWAFLCCNIKFVIVLYKLLCNCLTRIICEFQEIKYQSSIIKPLIITRKIGLLALIVVGWRNSARKTIPFASSDENYYFKSIMSQYFLSMP